MIVNAVARILSFTLLLSSAWAGADTTAPEPVTGVVKSSDEYVKTGTGLQYADIKVGTGPAAHAGQRVTVHYTGWLKGRLGMEGKKFDSSRDRGEPFQFM